MYLWFRKCVSTTTVHGSYARNLFSSTATRTRWLSAAAFCIGNALLLTGCGSTPFTPQPGQAVVITTQPLSQSVPISQTATFTVTANGTAPISYQWTDNGVAIPGATTASYTTPPISYPNDGTALVGSYQVTVSNASSSAVSAAATLTAGPRSPKPGDLRYLLFEQVDIPGLNPTLASGISTNGTTSATNAVGTPLQLEPSDVICAAPDACGWRLGTYSLPPPMTGLSMFYQADSYSNFTSDLQSVTSANVVIDSLDLESVDSAYAMAWVQTSQTGGFDFRLEVVPQASIQATVTQDGAESRIVTAVSFDDQGQVNLLSYGWQGDVTTTYEAQTIVTTPSGLVSAATTLAGEGYFISAFGGNDTIGYVLVGMRVKGDTLARPLVVSSTAGDFPATGPDSAYFTTVVYYSGSGGSTIITEQ